MAMSLLPVIEMQGKAIVVSMSSPNDLDLLTWS